MSVQKKISSHIFDMAHQQQEGREIQDWYQHLLKQKSSRSRFHIVAQQRLPTGIGLSHWQRPCTGNNEWLQINGCDDIHHKRCYRLWMTQTVQTHQYTNRWSESRLEHLSWTLWPRNIPASCLVRFPKPFTCISFKISFVKIKLSISYLNNVGKITHQCSCLICFTVVILN